MVITFAESSPPPVSGSAGELLQRMRELSVEDLLLPLFVQFMLIIAAARLFAWLFRRIGQPSVVGEVAAGLILGPSFLGYFFPDLFNAIFKPALAGLPPDASDLLLSRVITSLAETGLVLLLFLVGLEFDFGHLRFHGKAAAAISVVGIAFPFTLGAALGWWAHPLVAPGIPRPGFVLFMGAAMSITAMPVLARMMLELDITRTRLATITISAAAANDAIGWILLAALAAGVRAEFNPLHTGGMIAATAAFVLFMVVAARPVLSAFVRKALEKGNGDLGANSLAAVLVLVFLCSLVTNLIGIFAVFGAFTLGAVLSGEHEFRQAFNRRIRDLVTVFFLPIFFAYTGLRTNVGALDSWQLWGVAFLVCAAATLGKFGGCAVAARWSGLPPRESACVGVMMNTRGLMELVVINVGKDLGVIPDSMFCMLVLMAVVTTFLTVPALLWLMPGTELEGPIRGSEFLGREQPEAPVSCGTSE